MTPEERQKPLIIIESKNPLLWRQLIQRLIVTKHPSFDLATIKMIRENLNTFCFYAVDPVDNQKYYAACVIVFSGGFSTHCCLLMDPEVACVELENRLLYVSVTEQIKLRTDRHYGKDPCVVATRYMNGFPKAFPYYEVYHITLTKETMPLFLSARDKHAMNRDNLYCTDICALSTLQLNSLYELDDAIVRRNRRDFLVRYFTQPEVYGVAILNQQNRVVGYACLSKYAKREKQPQVYKLAPVFAFSDSMALELVMEVTMKTLSIEPDAQIIVRVASHTAGELLFRYPAEKKGIPVISSAISYVCHPIGIVNWEKNMIREFIYAPFDNVCFFDL